MSFRVEEVISEADFHAIATLLFDAFTDPHNPFFEILNCTLGTREEQIQRKANRHAHDWISNSSCKWVKVIEPAKGRNIVAVACWFVYENIPPRAEQPFVATWQPESSTHREFATRFVQELKVATSQRMKQPHLELGQLATHPSQRRRGAAGLLTQWGLGLATKLGLETYVDAVPLSVPFYRSLGFVEIGIIHFDMSRNDPSEEWKRLQSLNLSLCQMKSPSSVLQESS